MFDGGRRMFRRLDIGFLIRQPKRMENTSDIGTGVIDAPFFPNEIGDDPGCPAIDGITRCTGSGEDDGFEFLPFGIVEFFGTARLRFSCEGVQAIALDLFSPTFDRGERNFENVDDFVVAETT